MTQAMARGLRYVLAVRVTRFTASCVNSVKRRGNEGTAASRLANAVLSAKKALAASGALNELLLYHAPQAGTLPVVSKKKKGHSLPRKVVHVQRKYDKIGTATGRATNPTKGQRS